MKNPFALTLAEKTEKPPVVDLDEGRNGLIAHLRLPARISSFAPRALDEEINAYMAQVVGSALQAMLGAPCP